MFNDILGALPTATPYAIFILILIYLMKLLISSDRRHNDEINRMRTSYRDELVELRADIKQFRIDLDTVTAELKTERRSRQNAEEEAFRLRLKLRTFGENYDE